MTPHPHFPTVPQAARLLNAVANHVTRPSVDGVVYRYQNQAVEITRKTAEGVVIATLDRRQTLYTQTSMVCMMLVPFDALVVAGQPVKRDGLVLN